MTVVLIDPRRPDRVAFEAVGLLAGAVQYTEDVRAETDMNVVATGRGLFVEVQGTAEGAPFDKSELDALLTLATDGTARLTEIQTATLAVSSS